MSKYKSRKLKGYKYSTKKVTIEIPENTILLNTTVIYEPKNLPGFNVETSNYGTKELNKLLNREATNAKD